MRCQRVLWSLSWRHSQRCGASRPFSSQPLRWSSSRAPEDSFKQFYWDEENVLYLYAIQRVQLAPNVQEDVKLRDGKQHVDITWQLGEHGERLAGSGRARSKKQARREAAKKLLKLLPVGKEAEIQMRKKMLQGLRYKLSAEVVEDGVAGAVNNDRGLQQIYRVLWKVPRPQGRAPAEVSAEGRGGTVAEAQADAWENLYIQARRKNLHAAASQAVYEEREERKRQQLEDAAEQRQQQVNEGMSILTSEAASELAVRHNTVVQRLRIQAKDEMAAHEAGYHCVLHWSWEDPSGESRSARSSGLGSSKRQARGEAMQKMLAEQGFGSFEATALNDAARVRGLAKAGDPQSTPLACSFMLNWPTSHWGLVLIEVWQSALARQDLAAVQELGAAVQSVSDGLGPQLWESLLDAPAHVACGKTAMEALKALQGVSLIASGFPSYAHRDYFQHFRLLTAMERIGANQAMVEELRSQSDVMSLRMRQQNCVLPYLTLAPASSGNAHWSPSIFTELRQGDVVYLKSGRDHLAVITSIVKEDGKQKLTLRCHTLSLDDVDEEWFDVYGLESEVTTLRCISALWSASQPHASLEERPATQLMLNREMTKILVESFLPEGLTKAREVARSLPPGCDPGSMDQRLQMLQKSIPSHVNLSESQMRSVQSALQQRLTLIHGPPGTGKTTAAVSVLSAWRSLGDRILCAADSNVAADNLHQNLQKWGVKSYRFSPTEMHQTGERATAYQRMLAIQDAIGSFQIVVTTCASAGHELLRGYNFPRVLIDESTQSIEPSTLLPIINGCSHLVLIGDHRQLPPTVISDDARRLGLDRSLFARLAEPKANAVVEPLLLNEQRRMHPSIAEFPNRHFYNGLVQDQVSSRPPIPGVQFPQQDATRVLLVDCAAETAETAEEQYGTSWRNVAEVQAVRDFVAHVLSPSRHGPKPLEPEQIVVLTPYLQKELLQSALEKAKLQVRVSTVDGFQGAEADLVLFSAVRANLSGRLGFLQDTRRANVALTRARRGLVVFADATTLRESKGSVWATWLEWLEARDGIRELDELYQDVLI